MGFKRPVSVLVVIHDGCGNVLVLQRMDDPEFWQSVTGSLEIDESPIDAAYREVAEETGILIQDANYTLVDCHQVNTYEIRPRWRYRYPPGVTSNTEYVYSVAIDASHPILLTEHSAYQWLTKEQASEMVWSHSNQHAIDAFVPVNS